MGLGLKLLESIQIGTYIKNQIWVINPPSMSLNTHEDSTHEFSSHYTALNKKKTAGAPPEKK
jgi:hypothetical protein